MLDMSRILLQPCSVADPFQMHTWSQHTVLRPRVPVTLFQMHAWSKMGADEKGTVCI